MVAEVHKTQQQQKKSFLDVMLEVNNIGVQNALILLHLRDFKFKSLTLAYRVIAGSAPTYLNALEDRTVQRAPPFLTCTSSST